MDETNQRNTKQTNFNTTGEKEPTNAFNERNVDPASVVVEEDTAIEDMSSFKNVADQGAKGQVAVGAVVNRGNTGDAAPVNASTAAEFAAGQTAYGVETPQAPQPPVAPSGPVV